MHYCGLLILGTPAEFNVPDDAAASRWTSSRCSPSSSCSRCRKQGFKAKVKVSTLCVTLLLSYADFRPFFTDFYSREQWTYMTQPGYFSAHPPPCEIRANLGENRPMYMSDTVSRSHRTDQNITEWLESDQAKNFQSHFLVHLVTCAWNVFLNERV